MGGYVKNQLNGKRIYMDKDELKIIRECKSCMTCTGCIYYNDSDCENFYDAYGLPADYDFEYD